MIFDEGSGDTHLVDPLAAELLMALAESPADLPTLIARLTARLGLEPDVEIADHVRAAIDRFRELGLVEGALP